MHSFWKIVSIRLIRIWIHTLLQCAVYQPSAPSRTKWPLCWLAATVKINPRVFMFFFFWETGYRQAISPPCLPSVALSLCPCSGPQENCISCVIESSSSSPYICCMKGYCSGMKKIIGRYWGMTICVCVYVQSEVALHEDAHYALGGYNSLKAIFEDHNKYAHND